MRKSVVSSALLTLLALGPACGGQDYSTAPDGESAEQAESELRNLQPGEIVGSLTYGHTSAPVAYHAPPKYRAFTFSGNAGDKVDAWVRSNDGDAVAYLLAPNFRTLKTNDDDSSATRDSHIQATLTASGTHYIAFREQELDDASFTVSLANTAAPQPPAGPSQPPAGPPPSPTVVSDFPGGPPPAGAPTSLDIVRDQTLDGEIVVNGAVVIHSGAHVTVPTGKLLVRARSILVEQGASVVAAPTGRGPGAGVNAYCEPYCYYSGFGQSYRGSGGSHGEAGEGSDTPRQNRPRSIYDNAQWPWVSEGSAGGTGIGYGLGPDPQALGGGSVAFAARDTVTVAGSISANGAQASPLEGENTHSSFDRWDAGASGGSGGGVTFACPRISASGPISVEGGAGAAGRPGYNLSGGRGGDGIIKFLSAGTPDITGALSGVVQKSLLPPTWITSATHPDQAATYQDGTSDVDVHWSRPFASVSGYYVAVNGDANAIASQTTGKFQTSENIVVPRASLNANGTTYVHVASVDASGQVSLGEARFAITLSDALPIITSTTHPDRSLWPNRTDAQLAWTLPLADSAYTKVHYVLDRYGSTIPTKRDAALPLTQKQLFLPNQPSGTWVLHLLAEDKFGNLTSKAAHYVFNTGANPGIVSVLGTVTKATGKPIANASITVNRGLFSLVTDAMGSYNFQTLPAGTWEVSASSSAGAPVTRTVSVAAGGFQRADFSL